MGREKSTMTPVYDFAPPGGLWVVVHRWCWKMGDGGGGGS